MPKEWDGRVEHGELAQSGGKMLILGSKWMSIATLQILRRCN